MSVSQAETHVMDPRSAIVCSMSSATLPPTEPLKCDTGPLQ
jgi:hypothetical protein